MSENQELKLLALVVDYRLTSFFIIHTSYIDTTNTEENPNENSCLWEYLVICASFILLVALIRFLTNRDIRINPRTFKPP